VAAAGAIRARQVPVVLRPASVRGRLGRRPGVRLAGACGLGPLLALGLLALPRARPGRRDRDVLGLLDVNGAFLGSRGKSSEVEASLRTGSWEPAAGKVGSVLLFPAPDAGPALSAEAACGREGPSTPAPVAVESAALLRLKSSGNQSTTSVIPTIHDCSPFGRNVVQPEPQ
jgi:hypothetical protein